MRSASTKSRKSECLHPLVVVVLEPGLPLDSGEVHCRGYDFPERRSGYLRVKWLG